MKTPLPLWSGYQEPGIVMLFICYLLNSQPLSIKCMEFPILQLKNQGPVRQVSKPKVMLLVSAEVHMRSV